MQHATALTFFRPGNPWETKTQAVLEARAWTVGWLSPRAVKTRKEPKVFMSVRPTYRVVHE